MLDVTNHNQYKEQQQQAISKSSLGVFTSR